MIAYEFYCLDSKGGYEIIGVLPASLRFLSTGGKFQSHSKSILFPSLFYIETGANAGSSAALSFFPFHGRFISLQA
jgi:hypothetical protein